MKIIDNRDNRTAFANLDIGDIFTRASNTVDILIKLPTVKYWKNDDNNCFNLTKNCLDYCVSAEAVIKYNATLIIDNEKE